MPSKRALKKEIKSLLLELDQFEADLDSILAQRNDLRVERDEWRAKYELLTMTPEYKLNAESAFQRGQEHSMLKFRAWLYDSIKNMNDLLKDSNEK